MKISGLFLLKGLTPEEMTGLTAAGRLTVRRYTRGEVILHAGTVTRAVGAVLSGAVLIESIGVTGDRALLGRVPAGQIFAESYALAGAPLMVDAVCDADAEVAFLDIAPLLGDGAPEGADRVIAARLLTLAAKKNLGLSERIFCTSPRRVRERVSIYLSGQAVRAGARHFRIPFDRRQMADYLGVERTALSKELSRMRADGLIDYHKNEFTLPAGTEL